MNKSKGSTKFSFFQKLKKLMFSVDFLMSIAIVAVCLFILNDEIKHQVMKDLLSTSIAVQSILFSIQLAAFAIVISFIDEKLMDAIQGTEDLYAQLIWHFKVTSYSLFVGLIASIASYTIIVSSEIPTPVIGAAILAGLTVYGIFASALSMQQLYKLANVRGDRNKSERLTGKGKSIAMNYLKDLEQGESRTET